MENKMKKKSMGRQKIEIKKIEKKSSLQVTFSKRRTGLFKKVSELSTIYGVAAAVLVESPGGKLFTFGTPSVENVISRYAGMNNDDQGGTEVNAVCTNMHAEAMNNLTEKKDFQELNGNEAFWWRKSIDDLGLQELEEFRNSLLDLKSSIMGRISTVNQMEIEIPILEHNYLQYY